MNILSFSKTDVFVGSQSLGASLLVFFAYNHNVLSVASQHGDKEEVLWFYTEYPSIFADRNDCDGF